MTSKPWRTVASVAIAMAASIVPATAAPPKKALPPAQPQAAPSSGMMVAVDERGQIRQPTREEALAMIREVEKMFSARTAETTTYGDGTFSALLGDGFDNLYLARINANGSIATTCVTDANAAASFLGAGALEEK